MAMLLLFVLRSPTPHFFFFLVYTHFFLAGAGVQDRAGQRHYLNGIRPTHELAAKHPIQRRKEARVLGPRRDA